MRLDPPLLCDAEVREWFSRQIPLAYFRGKRVLVLVPDATRTAPLPLLYDALCSRLAGVAAQIQVLIALGTHPSMDQPQIERLLGLDERSRTRYAHLEVFNHDWNSDETLWTL